MALWGKDASSYPKWLNVAKFKRNVVRTPVGWVRLPKKYGSPNELLVSVANTASLGTSVVTDVYHTPSTVVANNTVTTIISYNQPIQNLGGSLKLSVKKDANTSAVAVAPATTVVEGNKLKFTWTPTVAGTYKLEAQTAANASATAVSVRTTTGNGNTAVSLVISGTMSNTAGTVIVSAS